MSKGDNNDCAIISIVLMMMMMTRPLWLPHLFKPPSYVSSVGKKNKRTKLYTRTSHMQSIYIRILIPSNFFSLKNIREKYTWGPLLFVLRWWFLLCLVFLNIFYFRKKDDESRRRGGEKMSFCTVHNVFIKIPY